jgi:hypothetical protein
LWPRCGLEFDSSDFRASLNVSYCKSRHGQQPTERKEVREMPDETEKRQAGIGREKYWEECGVEEKIERSREQIKDLQRIVQHLEGIIHNLTEHSHTGEKMVIPFSENSSFVDKFVQGQRGYRRGRGDKEVYF